jgi:hypothetical protein
MKKNRSIALYVSTIAAVAALPLLAQPAAASPASGMLGQISIHIGGDHPQPQPVGWNDDQRRELRHVYWELEHADRDYNGHRHEAMDQIHKAAEIMGMDLHGDGYGEAHGAEPMRWSDHKLREARDKLADLVANTSGHEHEHLDRAVHELDHALEAH